VRVNRRGDSRACEPWRDPRVSEFPFF